jgi:conjugative relaxase-like TrwC/TraI family protein
MLTMSDEITTSEHRAAWDATISAPKSISLAALVGSDGRIRDAYRESVNEALKEFEKYLPKREAAAHPRITTNHSSE